MSNLSYRMQDTLRNLHKRPNGYYGSCTNSTMKALKKRGLANDEWTEVPGSYYRDHKWVITPAGVAVLEGEPTENDQDDDFWLQLKDDQERAMFHEGDDNE